MARGSNWSISAIWREIFGIALDLALMALGRRLATGASIDRTEAMAWSASEQGKDFKRASSEAWGKAAIAGNAEEARTTAFYIDEPERGRS